MLMHSRSGCCRRLGAVPPPAAAAGHELLPCGITVVTDAATLASDPDALKQASFLAGVSCRLHTWQASP